MRSLIACYEQWKFARDARQKAWWQWWRPDPTEWHFHRIYGPALDKLDIPITGLECMRRLKDGQWEYRRPNSDEQQQISDWYAIR